jgi:dTDP-4-dehydrorhamnose reductase
MLRLAKTHAELKVVEDQWGAPTWAGWIADATAQFVHDSLTSPSGSNDKQAMNKADGSSARQAAAEFFRLHGGIYNFVNSGCTTWRHFAEEIFIQASRAGLLGGAAPVVLGIGTQDYPTPAKRPGNSMLSLQALGQNLKIQPPTWQSSLSECFKGLQP